MINANCNSPISVYAEINDNQIVISCELFEHDGRKLFSNSIKGDKDQSIALSHSLANEIVSSVGTQKINQLDKLENDFNYTP
jgi:porphobilinogen deaminase